MESRSIQGLTLFFDTEERDAAELIGHACEQSVPLIRKLWGLESPEDVRVYVMTSWLRFVFHSAPWQWRILVAVSMPLLYFRATRLWNMAGGWAQAYGRRRAVGIKPPRLLQAADRSIGERIFVQEENLEEKVRHVTCHELVHAFAAHLRLPMWLNEGLALVTVDELAGKPMVQHGTLETVAHWSQKQDPAGYGSRTIKDHDALVYHVTRGYWLTRYLQDTQPELLQGLLAQRYSHRDLEGRVAAGLGTGREELWSQIDRVVASHFKEEEGAR
jgi:hypothetical protein